MIFNGKSVKMKARSWTGREMETAAFCPEKKAAYNNPKRKEIMMKKVAKVSDAKMMKEIPTIVFNSDVFECPNCHNTEYRLVPPWQNKSDTPCSQCGYSPMYRVQ